MAADRILVRNLSMQNGGDIVRAPHPQPSRINPSKDNTDLIRTYLKKRSSVVTA